jgi:hypothetical protein
MAAGGGGAQEKAALGPRALPLSAAAPALAAAGAK